MNKILASVGLLTTGLMVTSAAACTSNPAAPAPVAVPAISKTVTAKPAPAVTKPATATSRYPSGSVPPVYPVAGKNLSSTDVLLHYFRYITDKNYADAWSIGGANLSGGVGWDAWVAGYSTTADVFMIAPVVTAGSHQVTAYIKAVHNDGKEIFYYGDYYVYNGVITSAKVVLAANGGIVRTEMSAKFLSGPAFHRTWMIANTAGVRAETAWYYIWNGHGYAYAGKVLVPANGRAYFLTNVSPGTSLKVVYSDGYGHQQTTYANDHV